MLSQSMHIQYVTVYTVKHLLGYILVKIRKKVKFSLNIQCVNNTVKYSYDIQGVISLSEHSDAPLFQGKHLRYVSLHRSFPSLHLITGVKISSIARGLDHQP